MLVEFIGAPDCRHPLDDLSALSRSSADIALTNWPLTLLAGVGKDLVVLTVGGCESWVDIGVGEGEEDRGCPCEVVWWLGDV